MALCDFLADYLTAAYLTDAAEERRKKREEAEKKAKEDVIEVADRGDDPFAGMMAMKKKKQEGEDNYFGKGKGKKKPKAKKQNKTAAAAPFSVNIDSFEQFGMLGLNPPTTLDAVQGSVGGLRAKKEWYSQQPRGSVPTAKDVRKLNEKAVAKIRGVGKKGGKSKASNGAKNGGKFSISNDEFVPLGGKYTTTTTSAPLGLSWGNGAMVAAPVLLGVEPTPGEAA